MEISNGKAYVTKSITSHRPPPHDHRDIILHNLFQMTSLLRTTLSRIRSHRTIPNQRREPVFIAPSKIRHGRRWEWRYDQTLPPTFPADGRVPRPCNRPILLPIENPLVTTDNAQLYADRDGEVIACASNDLFGRVAECVQLEVAFFVYDYDIGREGAISGQAAGGNEEWVSENGR